MPGTNVRTSSEDAAPPGQTLKVCRPDQYRGDALPAHGLMVECRAAAHRTASPAFPVVSEELAFRMRRKPERRREDKKTARKTALLPAKRTPGHGRGKLYLAGVSGNKGGGRPPNWLRQRSRDLLEQLLDKLEQRVQGSCMTADQLTRAVAVTGRLGLPNQLEHSGPGGEPIPIEQVRNDLREMLKRRLAPLQEEEAKAEAEPVS